MTVSPPQLDRFQRAITRLLALQVDMLPTRDFAATLGRRAQARKTSIESYLDWLESPAAGKDVAALAQELTVGETTFFRSIEQFDALRDVIVPDLLARGGAGRPIRVLSAACASGEEPFSVAMTLRGMGALAPRTWSVLAIDVNPAMIEKARQGIYTAWALRDTPPALRERWFRAEGGKFAIDPGIRTAVSFEQRNLAADDGALWWPGAYDVVFCRNVLMYFTLSAAQAVVARIERSLAPDGVLFLGHAETLRGWSDSFSLRQAEGAFYYQRDPFGLAPPPARAEWPPMPLPGMEPAPMRAGAVCPPASPAPQAREAADAKSSPNEACDLFRQERFIEAQAVLSGLDDAAASAPEAMLLQALLLIHDGRFAQAEQACRRLLACDESDARAFYVLGLCREALSDPAGAVRDHRWAIELDTGFPMPRLHLGLLARRAGDRDACRRHLGEAIALLEREDPARLGLFGGGFGREALVALCRAEIRRCEDVAQ